MRAAALTLAPAVALALALTLPAPAHGIVIDINGWMPPSSPSVRAQGFRRKRSKLSSKLGGSHHSAVDVLTHPGKTAWVEGKFAYGKISKDLEHEDVTLYILRGVKWNEVVTVRTNGDGRGRFQVPGAWLKKPGPHHIALVVHGDATMARSVIWVVPKNRKVVIFDIDGTLTKSDSELFDNVVKGDPIAMRPDANRVAAFYRKEGVLPLYVTGRPYMLNPSTRRWMGRHSFPLGPLVTTKFVSQARPTRGGVGKFKRKWITQQVRRLGLNVRAAYGNAKTDVCAFAKAGIDPAVTFIIGENGGARCPGHRPTVGVKNYRRHWEELTLRRQGRR